MVLVFRCSFVLSGPGGGGLDHLLEKKLEIKAIIVTEPEAVERGWRFVVEVDSGAEMHRILVSTGFYPIYEYGDVVQMTGSLLVPENFQSENGRTFNYRGYLAKDSIHYRMNKPIIILVERGQGNWLKEKLFNFKHAFLRNVERVLPEPQSALAGGLVLGVKQSLGEELEEDFRKAGIIHIVVLSGYNITIIAEAFMKTLSSLPKHIGIAGGAIGIILFAIITGGTATVVRSSIMALIALLGKSMNREYDAYRGLAVAAYIMVFHNPHILLYDPSFQLSFLATLGLMMLSPHLEKYFVWVTEKFGLRSIFTSTLATQIFVLPYLLYQIGDVSVVGLVVNILVLPIIPITMLCVFLSGMAGFAFGFIGTVVSQIFSFPTYALLAYEIKMVEVFAELPFASVSFPAIPLWSVFVMYGVYAVVLWKIKTRRVGG